GFPLLLKFVSRSSGTRAVVTHVLDVVDHHHLVILVDRVVTVDGEAALHVTETDEQFDLVVEPQLHDVLAGELDVAGLYLDAVAAEDPELLEVDVHRVLPGARLVLDDPALELVHLRSEAEHGAVHELPVHLPAAVAALEAERAREPWHGRADVGQPD